MKNHRRFGLGSGPSGCPKARSRRFDAGVGPVGLPEKTLWATVEASATASEGRVARARFRKFGAGSWHRVLDLDEDRFESRAFE